jgi:hypothetical protein
MQQPNETAPNPFRGDAGLPRPAAPPRPEPPPSVQRQSHLAGCLALALAGMAVMFVIAGLILLSSGLLAYALLVGGAFFAYALFHYAVWGWWLSGRIRRDALEEEAEA